MDMISELPPGIIETILCLVPIQEAARTSILSKEWRYHWIKIPKLAFIQDTFQVSTQFEILCVDPNVNTPSQSMKIVTKWSKILNAIYQVMLMHEGPIDEFILSIYEYNSCIEVDPILFHLSRKNTLKKLTLVMMSFYELPLSFFSLSNLTDLNLSNCALEHEPTFNGFGSLTTLFLYDLRTSEKTLMHLLSSCPLLKTVTLTISFLNMRYGGDSTLFDLFECIPMVENLTICFDIIQCFLPKEVHDPNRVPKVLTTALVNVRYLCIESISFNHIDGLPFLFLLIKSSPNLKKLKLEITDDSWYDVIEFLIFTLKDYSDIWLVHLKELEILSFSQWEKTLDFVMLILAKSPTLKKVTISRFNEIDKDEELEILRILLHSPRASPVVEIIVGNMETN